VLEAVHRENGVCVAFQIKAPAVPRDLAMSCSVDRLALLKILLHSAKYPDSSINGLLLGRVSTTTESSGDANNQTEGQPVVHVEDTVPLFHSFLTTAPYLEIALLQVRQGLCKVPLAWYSPASFRQA
jgi:hypothetical protein